MTAEQAAAIREACAGLTEAEIADQLVASAAGSIIPDPDGLAAYLAAIAAGGEEGD